MKKCLNSVFELVVLVFCFISVISCTNDNKFEMLQKQVANRVKRNVETIHTVWIEKHALTNEESLQFMKGTDYEKNMTKAFNRDRELAKQLMDSIKTDFEIIKRDYSNKDSYNELVSLYSNLQEYYNIAVNPKGLNDRTPICAEQLRMDLEKQIMEFELKHIKESE